MNFLDIFTGAASSVWGWFTSGNIASSLLRTVVTGFALNQVSKSIQSSADTVNNTYDPGVRVQSNADTEKKIPVIYGSAILGGIITDAYMTPDGLNMYFCLTICERTGNLAFGYGDPSTFTFRKTYWNDSQMIFQGDGITVSHLEDRDGNIDDKVSGLIKVWTFNGTNNANAKSIMPEWTANHNMPNLIFAIVKVTYNKDKGVTGLGNMRFDIKNSMTLPGDCLFDYMTNNRYGANLDPTEINIYG